MLAGDVPPTLDPIADITIDEDSSTQTIFLQGISAGSGESQPLRVSAISSDTRVLPHPTINYTSPKTFAGLSFAPVPDASGTVTVTVQVEDGGPDGSLATVADNATSQQTFTVYVLSVNDAPTLDSSGSPTLGTVAENAPQPSGAVGVLVSSLVDVGGPLSNFSDADGDAAGIAVTATNLEGGTLWYSRNNGATWSRFGDVSENAPALFVANAVNRLYFQPAAEWNGTISDVVTFRGWDQNTVWEQVGDDLSGSASADNAGRAVAMSADGMTLAVGAPGSDRGGSNAGSVTVYHRASAQSAWVPRGNPIDGLVAGDGLGTSLSISSDGLTLAVAIPLHDANGRDSGRVLVFRWDEANGWGQLGSAIDGEAAFDRSGSAISLSGDATTLAIGAFGNDEVDIDAGHARVFRWQAGVSDWVQLGDDINGIALTDGTGTSVSLSADGGIVAVGGPRNTFGRGHLRTFKWDAATSSWQQMGADLVGEEEGDNFGGTASISADGLTLAVGAVGNDASGYGAGHVRVFRWNSGTSSWVQQGADLDGEAAYDNSATSLALSADGGTVVIGATGNDGGGDNSGHARVYRWDAGSSAWRRVVADIDGEASQNSAGSSVAVSADGQVIAVGALANSDSAPQAGHVRVFQIGLSLSAAVDTASVTVQRPDSPPTLDAVAGVSVDTNAGEQTVTLTGITAGGGDSQPLRVTAISRNTSIIPQPVVTYTSPETTALLAFTPVADAEGSATITVTVEDGGADGDLSTAGDNGSVQKSFVVTVTGDSSVPRVYDSVLTFTSNGLWLLNSSDGTRFEQTTFAVWGVGVEWEAVLQGDFNGDGLMDVAGRTEVGQWWASINQGDGTAAVPQLMTYWKPSLGVVEYFSGDLNGDGRSDVFGRNADNVWWAGIAKEDSIGFTNTRIGAWSRNLSFTSVQTGDFDADGRTDIAGLSTTGQWIGLVGTAGGGWETKTLGFWSPSLEFTSDIVAGDFNNDGRTDIAGRTAAGQWWTAVAGSDTVGFTNVALGNWSTSVNWSNLQVGDFNGDGQSDIIGRASNGQWWGLISDGTNNPRGNTQVGYWRSNVLWAGIATGDADGDGVDELLGRVATQESSARGALWIANVVDQGLMQSSRWGFQGVAESVEARNLFFARFR